MTYRVLYLFRIGTVVADLRNKTCRNLATILVLLTRSRDFAYYPWQTFILNIDAFSDEINLPTIVNSALRTRLLAKVQETVRFILQMRISMSLFTATLSSYRVINFIQLVILFIYYLHDVVCLKI